MNITGWGRNPIIEAIGYSFDVESKLLPVMESDLQLIPYAMGRSYGDSALQKNVVLTKRLNNILSFDKKTGVVVCESGATLSDLIDVFLPKGYFLSVTPGTKYISVGGAIASDVHGKNHHVSGSFSESVLEFRLMLPDKTIVTCSRNENIELFKSTCGGMGLTGVILTAAIQLKPVNSSYIDQVTIKTNNLKETFEAFEHYKDSTYSVAWIDCLAKGEDIGRCLLMVGEHSSTNEIVYSNKKRFSVPIVLPSFVLNNKSVKVFNYLYYAKSGKGTTRQTVSIDSFFYPLDVVGDWNKIYGKNGFTQYQFVLPVESSYEGLKSILEKVASSNKGSFLSVLKLFGEGNDNYLSFPMKGYTLIIDFKIEPGLFELLDELDRIVLEYGGRFYLSKDMRLSKNVFEAGYEKIDQFRSIRTQYDMNRKFNSLQSLRIGL